MITANDIKLTPAGPIPDGYDIGRIKENLATALNTLDPGKTGGIFTSGTFSPGGHSIIVAAVQKIEGEHVTFKGGVYFKHDAKSGATVGFQAGVEW